MPTAGPTTIVSRSRSTCQRRDGPEEDARAPPSAPGVNDSSRSCPTSRARREVADDAVARTASTMTSSGVAPTETHARHRSMPAKQSTSMSPETTACTQAPLLAVSEPPCQVFLSSSSTDPAIPRRGSRRSGPGAGATCGRIAERGPRWPHARTHVFVRAAEADLAAAIKAPRQEPELAAEAHHAAASPCPCEQCTCSAARCSPGTGSRSRRAVGTLVNDTLVVGQEHEGVGLARRSV